MVKPMIAHAGNCRTLMRNAIRYGIGILLTLMFLYLYIVSISVYQEKNYPSDTQMEAIVREIRIAKPNDVVDVRAVSPYEKRRWVVVFEVNKVLKGSFARPKISFMVHSPSMELGVREAGERVALRLCDFPWRTEGHPPLYSGRATAAGEPGDLLSR